jgi:hypothetical protein
MTRFLRQMAATIVVAAVPLTALAIATSSVSSAGCDPRWSRNVWTGECHKPPPPPDWWVERPAYAPPYAPLDVPPPPPPPPWAQRMQPKWDEGSQKWYWAGI